MTKILSRWSSRLLTTVAASPASSAFGLTEEAHDPAETGYCAQDRVPHTLAHGEDREGPVAWLCTIARDRAFRGEIVNRDHDAMSQSIMGLNHRVHAA